MPDRDKLRTLRTEDVPAAFELSAQAGWNQTEEDWLMLLALAPKTCFAIEVDGRLAATTTLLCYGQRLAWIGMVLTATEFRRRGFAKKLFCEALRQADQLGIQTVKLDATEQGQPLYEQFGFRGEVEVERWIRPNPGKEEFPVTRSSSPLSHEMDSNYFGADRLLLLKQLAKRNLPAQRAESYLFCRPGRVSAYLGPCVSDNPEDVRCLISNSVENSMCSWYWDLFPGNKHAVKIAQDLGFAPQRHLLRMSRGGQLAENRDAIYAIAGFELG